MSRRDRQRAQLRELCRTGPLWRAVDLTFAHFADFGRDEEVVSLLTEAIEGSTATALDRRRFAELQATHPVGCHSSASRA